MPRPYVEYPKLTHEYPGDFVDWVVWDDRVFAITRYGWLYKYNPAKNALEPVGRGEFGDGEHVRKFLRLGQRLILLTRFGKVYELNVEDNRYVLTFITKRVLPEIDADWRLEVRNERSANTVT